MFRYETYVHGASGRVMQDRSKAIEKNGAYGTKAVYAEVLSDEPIDSDKGVCIEFAVTEPVENYMAIYRYKEFWCRPFFGTDCREIPEETQALILKLKNGQFCAVVPVVNDTYKCVLEGKGKMVFAARSFSWAENLYTCKGLAAVYAVGENPQELMNHCVKSALELLNSGVRTREERRYPEVFEYLGWCSWDSMQIRVNEEGIVRKCEEFREKEIPVKWAIFDDMWAEIRDFYGQTYEDFDDMVSLMHRSSMYHFEADPIRFPNGLAHCVQKVKEFGLKVGMWMPTTGYWRGFDPEGTAYQILKDYLICTKNGVYVPDWQAGKSYLYYKTLHDFFRKCGAEFVKIDNQSMTRRFYKGLAPVGKVAKAFHDGMEASVGEHFDNAMINCMGTASEDIWSRSASPISRCSDDFLPENRAWFTKHVLQCAYLSLLQGEFYWCDWDMWWTDDGQALKNSLMRAISGGPVYVSDMLERSRKEVLDPLVLSNGKILRCDRPATPTWDCVTEDPTTSGRALKIQNMAGEHGIMAVVNLDEKEGAVKAVIRGEDIHGFAAKEYAVYEHFSKECVVLKEGEFFEVTLEDANAFRLYIFVPLKDGFGVIGRTDKFISPKTIKDVYENQIILQEEGPYAYVRDGKLHMVEK